jgi:branched-chain amino acid transport system permease protein
MAKGDLRTIPHSWQHFLIRLSPYLAGGFVYILLPFIVPPYLQSILSKVLILAIFAMSLDILWGYSGLLSLGHAAYFGTAGYACGILLVRYGIESFWITAAGGIFVAVLVAALFGVIALRVSGIYFLLVTFALGQLVFSVVTKWDQMTGGSDGLVGIPSPDLGFKGVTWNALNFHFLVFVAFVVCVFLLARFVRSPFGLALQGIRDNEPRMRSLGYNTWLFRYIGFLVAGLFAGVAGVFLAYQNGVMAPMQVGVITSGLGALMCIIGGIGTLFGPVVGATVIVFAELLASMVAPERWPLILGVIFVAAAMAARGGIGGYFYRLWRKACSRCEAQRTEPSGEKTHDD